MTGTRHRKWMTSVESNLI